MTLDRDLASIQEARARVRRAKAAGEVLAGMEQETLDRLAEAVARAGEDHAQELARLAVEETGFGVAAHKALKNRFAARRVWEAIRGRKVVGLLGKDEAAGVWEFGVPVGVVAALIPSTNPTSTVLYKALICLKAGDSVVFSPHPGAVGCILRTVELVREAVARAGGPADAVSALSLPTPEGVRELMGHRDTRRILATGGDKMVRAAYASGTPAIGVGAGNSPVYLHPSCDLARAVGRIVASKTFDNGIVCASEQAVVVERSLAPRAREELERQGGYFLDEAQRDALARRVLRRDGSMDPAAVGRSAGELCRMAGLADVPAAVRVLLVPQVGVGPAWPFSQEKLAPILAWYEEADEDGALARCVELLRHQGAGHTFAIHARDLAAVERFARAVPAARVLVNTPAALGGIGATTGLFPALTLGCGAVGGSSTSDNVGPWDLVDIKRVAWGRRGLEDLEDGRAARPGRGARDGAGYPAVRPGRSGRRRVV